MAKIQINVDTETKELEVTINGTVIPDVDDVSIYSYRDSNGNVTSLDVSLNTTVKTVDGLNIRVTYYSYASVKAQNAIASGQKVYSDVKGFVGIEDKTQATQDIDDFLSSQKHTV